MNDEMFRLSLIDITNNDLLNDFVNNIFGYDFDFDNEEYVYIQYKIVSKNIVLNIYDNKNSNRFKAYIFTLNNINSDDNSIYINVNDEYNKYSDFLGNEYDKEDADMQEYFDNITANVRVLEDSLKWKGF